MLKPSECFAAPISAATATTLVLPRYEFDYCGLIVMRDEVPFSICLNDVRGMPRFTAFNCNDNYHWRGLHIPGVEVELDETSLYNVDGFGAPLGSMTRQADKLMISVSLSDQYQRQPRVIPIFESLPPCAPNETACFMKWQIVLGDGENKRILHEVNVGIAAPTS